MNELIYSVLIAFKDLTRKSVIKSAITYGVILSLIWSIVGYIIWTPLTTFTSKFLELIPFSFIKSDGAWMLSSLLFIQAVFITLSFIIILLSVFTSNENKNKNIGSYIFIIFLFVVLFWSVVWLYNHAYIYNSLEKVLTWFPFETVEKTMAYIFAVYILYNLFVISMLMISSLKSQKIINNITDQNIKKREKFKVALYTIKDSIIFFILGIILFPALFVPIVNIFIQIFIWVYLIKDTFTYDIGLLYFDEDELIAIIHKKRYAIYFISFIAALFNFLPIVNIFSPFFGEFAMYHYFESINEDER